MLSSEITRELQSLTQTWRNNNFVFTGEQRRKYDRLLSQRREFIKQWKEEGRVYSSTHQPKLRLKKERHEIYQRYKSKFIGYLNVRYKGRNQVLINYIKEKQMQKTIHLRITELF